MGTDESTKNTKGHEERRAFLRAPSCSSWILAVSWNSVRERPQQRSIAELRRPRLRLHFQPSRFRFGAQRGGDEQMLEVQRALDDGHTRRHGLHARADFEGYLERGAVILHKGWQPAAAQAAAGDGVGEGGVEVDLL